jgi:hypothetical protein
LVLVNANNGTSKPLVTRTAVSDLIQLVASPRLDSSGSLFYLYGESDGIFRQGKPLPTLSLVSSDADGITNRVVLRPESFRVREAFWTTDNSAIVILQNDEKAMPSDLMLLPMDASYPVVTLISNAASVSDTFRWGP